MRRATFCAGVIVAIVAGSTATAAVSPRDGRIVGRVLVCNAPRHCLTRRFGVSALNSAGRTVAKATTKGTKNAYRLRLSSGEYMLVAKSRGLVCRAAAVAVANQTTRRNITCLVP